MKKLILFMLCAVICLFACSCGDSNKTDEANKQNVVSGENGSAAASSDKSNKKDKDKDDKKTGSFAHAKNDSDKAGADEASNASGNNEKTEKYIISTDTVNTKVGEKFKIKVNLEAHENEWNSFEFKFKYDSSVIKITKVSATDITSSMLSMCNLDYAKDTIYVAFASGTDMYDSGLVATIECEAIASGSFTPKIKDELMYGFEGNTTVELPVEIITTKIKVK